MRCESYRGDAPGRVEVNRVFTTILVHVADAGVNVAGRAKQLLSQKLRIDCGDPKYRSEHAGFVSASNMIYAETIVAKLPYVNYSLNLQEASFLNDPFTIPRPPLHPSLSVYRATINQRNAQKSTGPRTEAGKQRSSLNALRHGLTARTAVRDSENQPDYETHCRQFFDQYKPANPTETQLVHELADTAWRLRRIPILEAELSAQVPSPESLVPALACLSLHGSRLSRQFQKTLDKLRDIQYERLQHEKHQLRDAAALLEFHK